MDRPLGRAVGRLWVLGFSGEEAPDDFLRLLERYPPRGVILFRDNFGGGGDRLVALRARLEEAAQQSLSLWLDEEGGWIQQLDGIAWPAPRAQSLSGASAVAACHRGMAARARELGVDVTCAPLADLDDGAANPVIGTRSFGSDPVASAAAVEAALSGLAAGGLLSVLKHFPGHGDSVEDSHRVLPVVPADRSVALRPFTAGIAAGAPAVMSAHLRLDDGDPRPATFRADLMDELLQGELGFRGLVVTDALEMAGAAVLPLADRGAAALTAGCHLLMLARWSPGAEGLLSALETALLKGSLPSSLVDRAEERWTDFWARRPGPPSSPLDPEPSEQGRGALFRPGGGSAEPIWDGQPLDVELGETGSWSAARWLDALGELPHRRLKPADALEASAYLFIGRQAPPAARLEELERLADAGREPALLLVSPWGWSLPWRRRLATADTSPAGLRPFLAAARMDAARDAARDATRDD